ncbi:MAG TPA: twin-arginine translocase TatA/TatE family subunit [Anseongella sp.]|nr:twin-arginine translocase TatA/TatE family subunit [Anseongella sp.]
MFHNNLLFLGGIGASEIIIIALIVLLLFGGRKIPELMRGLGRGVREFKDAQEGVREELDESVKKTEAKKSAQPQEQHS